MEYLIKLVIIFVIVSMRVAITGASGLIGCETVKCFIDNQIDFVALGRFPRSNFTNYMLTDYSIDSLINIFRDVDVVVHLAAIRNTNIVDCYQNYIDNEILTEKVLRAMAIVGVKRIIYMSSISVYSDLRLLPWSENQVVSPKTFYGLSKLAGEYLCSLYREKGISSTILRCAHVLGFEDKGYMLGNFLKQASQKKQLTVKGKSLAYRQFIYVKDVARAILWVILNNISGLFNLGLDKSYLNIQIAQMINRSFFNDTDINYIVDVDEGISSSYMDVSLLLREGFKANYDFESAILDIRKDKFC